MVRRSWRHVALGIVLLALIVVIGTIGYMLLGFGVARRHLPNGHHDHHGRDSGRSSRSSSAGKVFTIVLILAGVGTALYTLTVGLELLVEGHFGLAMERRRMDKQIASFRGHVIVCGWGRVGKAIARELAIAEKPVVIIDSDPARLSSVRGCPYIEGDASDDDVLREAGIERASALVAAVATDAGNLVITLSGRALQPDLFIVARAREETSAAKLERAGAEPRRQSAGDRRRPHGGVPRAAPRDRVPRRRDARP